MKPITPIPCDWTAEDAHLVISFLDELQDHLWAMYGDDIIAHHRELAEANARQTELAFDDTIEF